MANGEVIKKEIMGIDGVDLCAIMGVSKGRNIHEVYLDKIQNTANNDTKINDSEAYYWDCTMKEVNAKEFSIRSGKKVRKEKNQLIDEEYSFMVGNIDRRIIGENSILICKTENAFVPAKWTGDELPEEYILECQHYMRIAKSNKCYVSSLINGKRFSYKEILRDEKIINMIIKIEKDFWFNNVLKKVPPKVR